MEQSPKGNRMINIQRILILLLLVFTCHANAELKVGDKISNQPLFGLNTPSTKLSIFIGKPMIINFWASWCGPCLDEMESLNNIANDGDFTIIGISTDDDPKAAITLIHQKKLMFKNYIDHRMTLEKLFGVNTIPLTIIVDHKGIVKKIIKGSRQWDSKNSLSLIKKTIHYQPQKN
jgi:thiol-disulfide isomerase/thioredoxin